MDLPAVGDRIRAGALARVLEILKPNEQGNVLCQVEGSDGRLGWIVYYAEGGRSNVNFYPTDEVDALTAQPLRADEAADDQEEAS